MFELKRPPIHPGEILKAEFMEPMAITQSQLAKEIDTTFKTINQIVNEKRNISTEMAVRLARYFGTSEELWLNLQNQYDLYKVKGKKQEIYKHVKPFSELHGATL